MFERSNPQRATDWPLSKVLIWSDICLDTSTVVYHQMTYFLEDYFYFYSSELLLQQQHFYCVSFFPPLLLCTTAEPQQKIQKHEHWVLVCLRKLVEFLPLFSAMNDCAERWPFVWGLYVIGRWRGSLVFVRSGSLAQAFFTLRYVGWTLLFPPHSHCWRCGLNKLTLTDVKARDLEESFAKCIHLRLLSMINCANLISELKGNQPQAFFMQPLVVLLHLGPIMS